jgi:uncharacterized membrane protein
MFVQNAQGERRISPPLYKLLLTTHIIVSVGWLGVVVAKLVLGIAAATSGDSEVARGLYAAMQVVNPIFPPAAIGTILTGVLLSLGTKWALLQYYWVVAKLVLTVGVIASAVRLGDRLVQQASGAPAGLATDDGTLLGIATAAALLVISVFKPWGKTWFGRRKTVEPRLARRAAKEFSLRVP